MIQWIRGRLEASYVGEPSKLVLPSSDNNERRQQLRLYRAAVRDVVQIQPPGDARPPIIEPTELVEHADTRELPVFQQDVVFRQPRVDEAHVGNLRGAGTYFVGALFDLRVSDLALSFPTEKSGRSYGLMTGTVVACLVLPPEPAPERVPASVLVHDITSTPLAAGQLHVAPTPSRERKDTPDTLDEPEVQSLVVAPRGPALLPALALAALVCLALALQCGAVPALLWSVFMLPTLLARRLFVGMLPDTRGIHIVGALLVAVQLVCTVSLIGAWWSESCRELHVVPLLGVILVLFPAGLLPSPLPLLCNAISLAAILFGWCTHVTSVDCVEPAPTTEASSSAQP